MADDSTPAGVIAEKPFFIEPRASDIPTVILTTSSGMSSVPSASSINKTGKKAKDRQITAAALDALVPIPYGQVRLGALLANALVYQRNWVFWIVWGMGPIQGIDTLTMDDAALPSGVTVTNYTGAAGQGVDPTLAAAFAAMGGLPTFAETLAGVAYTVIKAQTTAISSPPTFNALLKGRKLYDPRLDSTNGGSGSQRLTDSTTWAWSRNPTLILADFLVSTAYGAGLALDWPSVIACANANDVVVGTSPNTEVKRLADFMVDNGQSVADWVETLRTAACVWLVPNGGTVKLVADVAGSSVATYTHAAGQILAIDSDAMQAPKDLPTVMEIVYTDTTQVPYRDGTVLAKRPGVDAGTTPWRKSSVRMPWITRSTQANREAIERLNKLWLRAASMTVHLMDEGLLHEIGDIITVTYPDGGYSSLPLRVINATPEADGWALSCVKEDATAYSSTVQAGVGSGLTNLPSPASPPLATGLAVVEEVYQVQTGLFASRLRVTWDDMTAVFPFVAAYSVTITQAGVAIEGPFTVPANSQSYITSALKENLTYIASVSVVSTIGIVGAPMTVSITNSGKQSKPSDVPSITGYEVGGEVRLAWEPAVDLDLTAHEIRYTNVGGSWADATLLDRVATPSVRYSTKVVPAGTFDFLIKGLDSVRTDAFPFGQESVNEARCTITVTVDATAFLAGDFAPTNATLYHMISIGQ
jgi:Putative phage tail protein